MDKMNDELKDLQERFSCRCLELIEKGVENGTFRMKDVALYLGISNQVASKLVNPTSPRIPTAFELFRLSVLLKKTIDEIIPPQLYMTSDELNAANMTSERPKPRDVKPLTSAFNNILSELPEGCRDCMRAVIISVMQTVRDINLAENTQILSKKQQE